MAEEDIDMLGLEGQGSAKIDRDRRTPRFSWTPAYETTFFRSLCDSVQLGLRENSSFKSEAWERAAQALQERHGASPTKSHLINKSDNARKRFRLWRGLREDPDFVYNSKTRTVTASEDAWRAHIEREPLSRALRGRPFDHEDYMEILYPDVIGSGGAPKRIMKLKRKTEGLPGDEGDMPGTSILNLQADQLSSQASTLEDSVNKSLPLQTIHTVPASNKPSAPPVQSLAPLPPRAMPNRSTALTPPEESSIAGRKRAHPIGTPQATNDSASSTASGGVIQSLDSPEKRQCQSGPPLTAPESTLNSSVAAVMTPTSANATPLSQPETAPNHSRKAGFEDVVDASSSSQGARQWREEAVDLFFKDFSYEDADLQINLTQKVLSNEHTAMVFCKMSSRVREHWVRSQREGSGRRR